MLRRLWVLLPLLVSWIGSTGCESLSRVSLCASLSDLTRAQLERVAALDATSPHAAAPEAYTEMGRIYLELEQQLLEREKDLVGELQQAVAGYRASLRMLARECERYSISLRTLHAADTEKDRVRSGTSTHELGAIRQRAETYQRNTQSALSRIDRWCSVH